VHSSIAARALCDAITTSPLDIGIYDSDTPFPIILRTNSDDTLTTLNHALFSHQTALLYVFSDMSAIIATKTDAGIRALPTVLRLASKPPKALEFNGEERLICSALHGRRNDLCVAVATKNWPHGTSMAANLQAPSWSFWSMNTKGNVEVLVRSLLDEITQWAALVEKSPLISTQPKLSDKTVFVPPFANLYWIQKSSVEQAKSWIRGFLSLLPPHYQVQLVSGLYDVSGKPDFSDTIVSDHNGLACAKSSKKLQTLLEQSPWSTSPFDLVAQYWVVNSHLKVPSKMRNKDSFGILTADNGPTCSAHDKVIISTYVDTCA
jgi:hypothetical protein